MLWPLHGSAGLHLGHGSCFSYTPFSGYPYASIPRHLAGPVFLSGVSPRGSSDCPPTLSRFGDCHPSQEFQPHTFPGSAVSVGRHRFHLFQGFSVGGTHLTAAIYSRRISVMRLTYRKPVAIASRRSFLAGSPRSWRLTWDVVPPALPPSFLVPSGSGGSSVTVDDVSSSSPVLAPSTLSVSRGISPPGVSWPTLLIRHLGRKLGRPSRLSGRFRPVGPPTDSVVYQRRGTARYSAGAFPVPVSSPRSHSGCLLRQHHSGDFPSQRGWHLVSSPQHLGSGDLALDGIPLHPPGSTVPSGLRQRPSRRPVSPSPAPTSRVVYTHDRLSVFVKTVAGSNSFFATSATHRCLIYFSPFRDPRSAGTDAFLQYWDEFRLTRSIRWLSSAYSREAPGLHGDGTHSCGSPLGSAPLVFGPGPALAGSSSDPTVPSRPPALASVSSSLPGSPSAQASCLATLQRFPRAAGFYSAVAEQSSLARRPSSRAVYQVRWSIYRGCCLSIGHSVSNSTLAMVADSCITYGAPEALVCPPCVVPVQFYLRFSVFTFHPCLRIRCFGFCYAPSDSLQRSVCYVPILGTCLWC